MNPALPVGSLRTTPLPLLMWVSPCLEGKTRRRSWSRPGPWVEQDHVVDADTRREFREVIHFTPRCCQDHRRASAIGRRLMKSDAPSAHMTREAQMAAVTKKTTAKKSPAKKATSTAK